MDTGEKAIADKRQAPNEEAIQRMKNNREAYQKSESHFSDEQNKWLNDRYSSSSTYDPRTEISEAYRNWNDNKAQELAKSAKSWVQGKMEEEQSIRNINRDRVDRNRADEIISGANINKETFDKHYNDESSRWDIWMAKLIGKQLKAIWYDVKGTEIGNGIQSFKGTEWRQSYYLSVWDKKIRFSNHGQWENPWTIYPRWETNEEYLNSIVRKLWEPQSPSPKISKPQPKANPAQNASKWSETEEGGMSVPEKGETKGTIPKELEPLAEEARKYKSAEEFVKSQPWERYFTGQRADWTPRTRDYDPSSDDSLMYWPWIYLTPDRSIAEWYARDGGVVHNVIANIKNPLKPTMKDWDTFVQKWNGKMKRDFLIRKWYDAVVDTKWKYKQVMIVNPETIHTEDQLRDLYNKATQQSPSPRISKPWKTEESLSPTTTESKGEMEKSIGNTWKSDTMGGVQSNKEDMIPKELEPLAEEARKYNSAEEFVKAINPNSEYVNSKGLMKLLLDDTQNYEEKMSNVKNRLRSAKAQIWKDRAKIEWRWTLNKMHVVVPNDKKWMLLERISQNEKVASMWEEFIKLLEQKNIYNKATQQSPSPKVSKPRSKKSSSQ